MGNPVEHHSGQRATGLMRLLRPGTANLATGTCRCQSSLAGPGTASEGHAQHLAGGCANPSPSAEIPVTAQTQADGSGWARKRRLRLTRPMPSPPSIGFGESP